MSLLRSKERRELHKFGTDGFFPAFGTQAGSRVRDPRVALTARAVVITMSVYDTSDESGESVIDIPDEPQPLADLTGFQRDILFVVNSLNGTNPNGTHIKTNLREIYGEEINHGRLYQNLRELVAEGLVEKRPVDGRTNAYQVSVAARECLEAHAAWGEWCLMDADTDEAV
jgi:DNA-binding HxlR family transcriptional regulator